MAISDAVQTSLAAFFFGILLTAGSGSLLVNYGRYGGIVFKDGPRLVLVLFLVAAMLWSVFEFVNLLLPTVRSTCQVFLVFSTLSDQFARVAVEQVLLWAVGKATKEFSMISWISHLFLQVIVAVRFIAGIVLVAFTRPQFAPTCVARTSVLPVSIVTISLDGIILSGLLVRAVYQSTQQGAIAKEEKNFGVLFSVVAFIAWTGTSIPMVLGIHSITLIFRTTLPAIGLLLLLGILTPFFGAVLSLKDGQSIIPEARSPFVAPPSQTREVVGTGTPVTGHRYTGSGTLYIVNPSLTPGESPAPTFPNYSRPDGRGISKYGNFKTRGNEDERQNHLTPNYIAGRRGSNGIFPPVPAVPFTDLANSPGNVPMPRLAPVDISRNAPVKFSPRPTLEKRSMFGRSKTPKKDNVRGLGISHPVLIEQDRSTSPFPKIPTVDLHTAAEMERTRREGLRTRTSLVASRPAPAPPTMATEEAFKRSISVKRKEAPPYTRDLTATVSSPSSSQLAIPNGSSTSASLSPGQEDMRRRSPRNLTAFNPHVASLNKQKRVNIGLPANPRSQLITMNWEMPLEREPVPKVVHDAAYENSDMVRNLIKGTNQRNASVKSAKPAKLPQEQQANDIKTPTSVIHRPRPVRRHTETERIIFPTDPSPTHKRSKSSGHVLTRKPAFYNYPGSPSQLPELPRPPTSAAELKRLLPNDTKSMTFDEKIQLLFPAPPGAAYVHHRTSSVPSVPRISSPFLAFAKGADAPAYEDDMTSQRSSKRLTIASFDHPAISETTKAEVSKLRQPEVSHFSTTTYRSVIDDVGDTSFLRMSRNTSRESAAQKSTKGRNTEYDMRKSTFTDVTTSDESMTNWGSIHSAVPPFDISQAMQMARTTFVQARDRHDQTTQLKPSSPTMSEAKSTDGYMTIMLDTNNTSPSAVEKVNSPHESTARALEDSTRNSRDGYFRIGDEVPTFSERRRARKSQKMPPPTPLLLKSITYGRQPTIAVRHAEPSPPLESPEHALQEIESQLQRLESTDRSSVGSMIRHVPEVNSKNPSLNIADRLRLLENLEKEMGQQESQWLQLHHNLDRDSTSTLAATPVASNRSEISSPTSTQGSQKGKSTTRTPPRVLSRRERIRNGLARRASNSSEDTASRRSSQVSAISRASVLQKRLVQSQTKYSENTSSLLSTRNLNLATADRAEVHMALGSPTPPDSASDNESELEAVIEHRESQDEKPSAKITKPLLWEKVVPEIHTEGLLWTPSSSSVEVERVSFAPPPKVSRRNLHKDDKLQPLTSSSLWAKPLPVNKRPLAGLWGSKPARPKSIVTRPVTQRPPRRSRRVTMLPDIVESPVPLPNNRETLGIFQFPWGETSDNAVYQPVVPPVPSQPIPMDIASRLNARSMELEPEGEMEYSSSFFDDYDEEDADLDQYAASESDDDFDETTLWEIASLLKTTELPSKDSLIYSGRSIDVIEDYDYESGSDYEKEREEEEDDEDEILKPTVYQMKLPIPPLAPIKSPRLPKASLLWEPSIKVPASVHDGLFSTIAKRNDYRYSTLPPAALNMSYKPYTSSAPLQSLTSTTLWEGPLTLPTERDWISESSIRPRSPSIYSPSSPSSCTSPLSEIDASDASSIASTSTKASSLWSSISSAATKKMPWFERKKGAKAADGNDVKHSRTPTRKLSVSALPALRESRVFDSNDLWISGGAISTKRAESPYDSSVCHPVFFTETLVSGTADIHPAAIGHVNILSQEMKVSQLWSIDKLQRGPSDATSSLLWSKPSDAKQEAVNTNFQGHFLTRRSTNQSVPALSALVSTALFVPIAKSSESKHWLHSTSQRRTLSAKTWTPPVPNATRVEVSLLWSPVLSTKQKDNYADFEGHQMPRRARNEEASILAPLVSRGLFKLEPQAASKNWLMVASQRQTSPARMWIPCLHAKAPTNDSYLWSKPSRVQEKENHVPFRGHAMTRRARNQESWTVLSISTTELFQPLPKSTVSKNWLIETSRRCEASGIKLWSPSAVQISQEDSSPLWSKQSSLKKRNDYFEGHYTMRRSKAPEPVAVLALESSELFKVIPKASAKNWLIATSEHQSLAKTWAPAAPQSISNNGSLLWSRRASIESKSQGSNFNGHELIRSSRPKYTPSLPVLTSTEFFKHTLESATISKDWLATTSELARAQR
ncbi:hypothetical protein F5884DRAFT_792462 [Xylogone sp. PMI_703]|nr:hypothetical protein F5884DRAFT_792462 [Xylogone sp. PMI_703]